MLVSSYTFVSLNLNSIHMKKTIFTLLYSLMAVVVMAGGIVTNTNQSASFIRNPARDASLGIDAAYFNPAGLSFLQDGFHLSLNNQFVTQLRHIQTSFPGLNTSEFEGPVSAPLFPSAYAVYKKNKFAFALGFNPIGGGGSAKYEDGLPSFEMQVASLPAALSAAGIPTSGYSFDTEFEGSSIYYGLQAGISYQLSDIVAVSIGARYVMIDNKYEGYLRDIKINPVFPVLGYSGSMVSAPSFFTNMAGMFQGLAGVAGMLQPLVDGGGANLTLEQAQSMGYLTAEQVASIAGGFAMIDPQIDPMMLNIAQIQGAYAAATPAFQQQQIAMNANAEATGDKQVDATQSGTGVVPFIGVALNFEKVNFGIKYEHKAAIKIKNDTKRDDVGMFPDGAEVPSDIPGLLTLGLSYRPSDRITLSAGYHTYFDKAANYGKMLDGKYVENKEVIAHNLWEFAFGIDFWVSEKFMLSAGYLVTETGATKAYQSDLNHSLSTFSFAGGLLFRATEKIDLNLGALRTFYSPTVKNFGSYGETYSRKSLSLAIGIDFHF